MKKVETRQLDSDGRTKSTSEDTYNIVPLGDGASFEEHVGHDSEPVAQDVRERSQKELEQLRSESPAQLAHRFEKERAERSYMKEVPDAFDFRVIREDNLPTGRAWVLEATPRPGYIPKSRYAHAFNKMHGTLWIDEKDVQWVKADAVASETVTFGWFIARLSKGSHIVLEQERLPDGNWVPRSLSARAAARMFLVFNHHFDEEITYNQYKRRGPLTATATGRP